MNFIQKEENVKGRRKENSKIYTYFLSWVEGQYNTYLAKIKVKFYHISLKINVNKIYRRL